MNLWLCEHVDLKLVDEICENGTLDILVHGNALTKFQRETQNFPISPMYWLDKTEQLTYSDEKNAWDKRSRQDIKQAFAIHCADEGRFNINPDFSGVFQKLFSHCSQGCLDALTFALSCPKNRKGGDSRVRVIVGENYRLTELVALVWWLAICNRRFGAQNVEYIWVSRFASALRVDSIGEVLSLLSGNTSTKSWVDGFIPESIRAGKEPVCLKWAGALKYPRGWDAEIHHRIGEPMQILSVVGRNSSLYHDSPCIEMAVGNGGSHETLHGLLQCADDALAAAWESLDDNFVSRPINMGNAIHRFFSAGAAPLVLSHISQMVDHLDQELSSIDLQGFFSTPAPLLESIALHEWAQRRNVIPVLLTHSWTSSHEFPASTYKAALTFVRSDFIMTSANDDPYSLAKEEVIQFDQIRLEDSLNSKRQKGYSSEIYKNVRLLLSKPFGQMRRIAWKYGLHIIVSLYSKRLFKRKLKKTKLKIGYLLNYEHYEFQVSLDFNDLFRFITIIAKKLTELLPRGNVALVLRRKVGWTNIHLLAWYWRTVKGGHHPSNLIISPDGIPLDEFGALCDLVLYFQGSSAVPELMSLGVAIIQLIDPNAPVMMDEPYIVLPEEIVPQMTIEDIINRFNDDSQWLAGLKKCQQDWISTQMAL